MGQTRVSTPGPIASAADAAGAKRTAKRKRVSAEKIGRPYVELVSQIPEVVAVAVHSYGSAFRFYTVIGKYDMDVCGQIFTRELQLYDAFPDLEADFLVLGQTDHTAQTVLKRQGYDFFWLRPAR